MGCSFGTLITGHLIEAGCSEGKFLGFDNWLLDSGWIEWGVVLGL